MNLVHILKTSLAGNPNLSKNANLTIRLLTIGLPVLLLSVVLTQPYAEPKWMFLDALTAAELSNDCCHTYYGSISNLGIMIWSATAAICLFTYFLLANIAAKKSIALFALTAGILTAWLALDDAFMLHELVLPSFGIEQNYVILAYMVLAILYVSFSWRLILKSDFYLLLIAGFALVCSIIVDVVFHSLVPSLVYLEDSAKFLGICCWAGFHISSFYAHFRGQNV